MEQEFVDPAISEAVAGVMYRFGAPGLDQLEVAIGKARSDAEGAVIALVERPHAPITQPSEATAPPVQAAGDVPPPGEDTARDPVPLGAADEASRRLADWRAASNSVRAECDAYWTGLTDQRDATDWAPTEEDRRRLNAFYAVEQAARDRFFSLIDAIA